MVSRWCSALLTGTWLLLPEAFLLWNANTEQVHARPVPDQGAGGTNTRVTEEGNRFNIEGGQRSRDGSNLFHSFERFDLSREGISNFISNPEIQNILARVTGGDASLINGLIRVTGGNSNLYLMNPAGIIFGSNARLDISASFTATTATGIGFGSRIGSEPRWFSATGIIEYTELTSTPSRFAFGTNQPGVLVNAGVLSTSEDLTLIGGTVVNIGTLEAPGNITIAAVPGQSSVRISQVDNVLSLDVQPLPREKQSNQRIVPPNQQILPVPPSTGGSNLNQWTLPVLALPQLLTGRQDIGNATGLTINSIGQVSLVGSGFSSIGTDPGDVFISGIVDASSPLTGLEQTGGSVEIRGVDIDLLGNINASGRNGGGMVSITSRSLDTTSSTAVFSTITADALFEGDGGVIRIFARGLIDFDGRVSASGGAIRGDGGVVVLESEIISLATDDFDIDVVDGRIISLATDDFDIGAVNGSSGRLEIRDSALWDVGPSPPYGTSGGPESFNNLNLGDSTISGSIESFNNLNPDEIDNVDAINVISNLNSGLNSDLSPQTVQRALTFDENSMPSPEECNAAELRINLNQTFVLTGDCLTDTTQESEEE